MPVRILVTAVTCATLGTAAMFIGHNPGARELAIDAIDRLAQRADLSGNVHLHSTRAGDVGRSIEFDRNGTLAAVSDDPSLSFSALTDGQRTAVQATWVGAPSDPAPAVREIDRLLDLARLKKAAASAEWTAAADGSLRARLDAAPFADLGAGGTADAVKAVNATLTMADGKPAQLVLAVVHASGTTAASGGDADGEWVTTANFRFTEQPAQAAVDARKALADRLKNAPAETPTNGKRAVPAAGASKPSPVIVTGAASPEAQQELIRRLTAAANGAGQKDAGVTAAAAVAKLIKGSDKDGDGKLSRTELGDAKFDSLKPFDANGDGLIDEQELAKALEAAVKQKAGKK